jgi:hypothetical protein
MDSVKSLISSDLVFIFFAGGDVSAAVSDFFAGGMESESVSASFYDFFLAGGGGVCTILRLLSLL